MKKNDDMNLNSSNKIVFIDRKKSKPIIQNNFEKFCKLLLSQNYKEEKIIFKILYDKIYRPELFNLITKGSENNLNLTRNLFNMNEENYEYRIMKNNQDLQLDDDDLYNENSFLLKLHRTFVIHKITIYLSVPFGIGSLYFSVINKSSPKFKGNLSVFGCIALFFINIRNLYTKEALYNSNLFRLVEKTNKLNYEVYKRFYYDLKL